MNIDLIIEALEDVRTIVSGFLILGDAETVEKRNDMFKKCEQALDEARKMKEPCVMEHGAQSTIQSQWVYCPICGRKVKYEN